MKKLYGFLAVSFLVAGAFSASAQQKVDMASYDSDKQAMVNNAKYQAVHPDEIAKANLLEEKMKQAKSNDGFLNIPGFTYTGDPVMDARNYGEALDQLKVNDAVLYMELTGASNTPSGYVQGN